MTCPTYHSLESLAKRFKTSKSQVTRWIHEWDLPYYKDWYGKYYFEENEIKKWIEFVVSELTFSGRDRIGIPEPTNKEVDQIIKAETDFMIDYLLDYHPDNVSFDIARLECEELVNGFYGFHPLSRWRTAKYALLGFAATEFLRNEGLKRDDLVGLESVLYSCFLRSLIGKDRHPYRETYFMGVIASGTFNKSFSEQVIREAKDKYGSNPVRGIVYGNTYWKGK